MIINASSRDTKELFSRFFESNRIWASGLIVDELCDEPSHWNFRQTLHEWLKKEVRCHVVRAN